MDLMPALLEVLKFAIAALIVYAIVKDLLRTYLESRVSQPLAQAHAPLPVNDNLLTIRLQAYERMALYCERIAPENLLMRLRPDGLNIAEYKLALMLNIRQEYEHNVTQQIYLSPQLWQIIKMAGEDTLSVIAHASEGLDNKADARQLHDAIISISSQRAGASEKALQAIKTEVASFLG